MKTSIAGTRCRLRVLTSGRAPAIPLPPKFVGGGSGRPSANELWRTAAQLLARWGLVEPGGRGEKHVRLHRAEPAQSLAGQPEHADIQPASPPEGEMIGGGWHRVRDAARMEGRAATVSRAQRGTSEARNRATAGHGGAGRAVTRANAVPGPAAGAGPGPSVWRAALDSSRACVLGLTLLQASARRRKAYNPQEEPCRHTA